MKKELKYEGQLANPSKERSKFLFVDSRFIFQNFVTSMMLINSDLGIIYFKSYQQFLQKIVFRLKSSKI